MSHFVKFAVLKNAEKKLYLKYKPRYTVVKYLFRANEFLPI